MVANLQSETSRQSDRFSLSECRETSVGICPSLFNCQSLLIFHLFSGQSKLYLHIWPLSLKPVCHIAIMFTKELHNFTLYYFH